MAYRDDFNDHNHSELREFWTEAVTDFHNYTMTGLRMARLARSGGPMSVVVLHATHNETQQPVRWVCTIDDQFVEPLLDSFQRLHQEIEQP